MSRPYVRKIRPQSSIHDCASCDGVGQIIDVDFDDEGERYTSTVSCEDCCGGGKTSDCHGCDEATPLVTLEMFDGRCGACVALSELAS